MATQTAAPPKGGIGETTTDSGAVEPKAYVFGGTVGKPQGGANSRRLWTYLSEHCTKRNLAALRREIAESHPDGDRFVRWQRIVAAAEKLGIRTKDGAEINQALVRRLAKEDKGGVIGRDAAITIL